MLDPIQRKDFNIHREREPNLERMNKIREISLRKRTFNRLLATHIREAIKSGHSYRQVASAAGVSVSVIQRMMKGEE